MKYFVYTLSCPITNEVRYVGKTNDLSKRLSAHCKDNKKSYKASWIKSLKGKGLKPLIIPIDETLDEIYSYQLEIYWINQFKAWGFNLTNLTNGGEGFTTVCVSGENSPSSKISEETAKLIIYDLKQDELTTQEICDKYNVGRGIVANIKYGNSWTILTGGKPLVICNYKQKKTTLSNRVNSLINNGVYQKLSVKVDQFDLEGNYIQSFNSITEASVKTKVNRNTIQSCLKNNSQTPKQFIWKKNIQ